MSTIRVIKAKHIYIAFSGKCMVKFNSRAGTYYENKHRAEPGLAIQMDKAIDDFINDEYAADFEGDCDDYIYSRAYT